MSREMRRGQAGGGACHHCWVCAGVAGGFVDSDVDPGGGGMGEHKGTEI